MMETGFRLAVNGAERSVACEPDTPLLDVLRASFCCGRRSRPGWSWRPGR